MVTKRIAKKGSRLDRELAKERSRPAARRRQARFRKANAKENVRLELRVSKEIDALIYSLCKRAGKSHKNVFAADLLSDLVKAKHRKTIKAGKQATETPVQNDFEF